MNDYHTRYETVRLEHQERIAQAWRVALAEDARERSSGTVLSRCRRRLGLRLIRLGVWLSFPSGPATGHPAPP
jgi:hypothetical protein